jgi:hypothetical protein
MTTYSRSTKLFLISTMMATAFGCGNSDSTLKGRVSDDTGSQMQALGSRSLGIRGFGGSGSVSAAAKVRVGRLQADGTLQIVAEAQIQAGGRYEVKVPANEKRLIAESVDASGNVVASAIVESSGGAGETVAVTPIDTESSIEAAVLARMAASGVALAECNAIDLRARINLKVAEAVKASVDAEVKIKALAEAIAAAQTAKVKAYASVGFMTSQSALFEAQLAAAKKLNAALDASAMASASDKAYVDFYGEADAAVMAMNANPKNHARAESVASVAFRATVKARFKSGASVDAVGDASLRAAAAVEARASAAAVASILAAGNAATAAKDGAATAAAMLRTQLAASANAAASAAAFAAWQTSISGSGSVSGSVVGNTLEVNIATAVTAQVAVSAIAGATLTLDTALGAAVNLVATTTGALDVNSLAQTIVSAYSTFQLAVDAQAAILSVFGGKAQLGLDVMATASGSFRIP